MLPSLPGVLLVSRMLGRPLSLSLSLSLSRSLSLALSLSLSLSLALSLSLSLSRSLYLSLLVKRRRPPRAQMGDSALMPDCQTATAKNCAKAARTLSTRWTTELASNVNLPRRNELCGCVWYKLDHVTNPNRGVPKPW